MKKIIFVLLAFCAMSLHSGAYQVDIDSTTNSQIIEIQNRIDRVGFTILNANGIEHRTVFDYSIKNIKNANSAYRNRQITVYKGLYNRLSSDDELAGVLAHEISHSVDSYSGVLRGYFSCWSGAFAPRKYESKADKRAVDYMVNAGYNPVAFIVVMSKVFPQERYEWYSAHPLASRRMMDVYEYIYKKYPEYLVNNKYKNDLFYQNFLLTSKNERAKFQKKVESKKVKADNI